MIATPAVFISAIAAFTSSDFRFTPRAEDVLDSAYIQSRREFRATRFLNTMGRPEHLRQAIEFDHVTRLLAGMIAGKAAMVRRMPILRGDDEIETVH